MIAILCAADRSNYKLLPGLDIYDRHRDAYNYPGGLPVIAHPPCAQWSKLHALAKEDKRQKDLAIFCFEMVQQYGGILEHPVGSSLFKYLGVKPTISVNQSWWGFPARKNTLLYFVNCRPLSHPLTFEPHTRTVQSLHSEDRSIMPLSFCQYLIDCVRAVRP